MSNRGLRTVLAVLAGLAVLYFGTGGSAPADGRRVTNAVLLLAAGAALAVWYLTRPGGGGKPVS
ncbi:hypothetical protein [Micromonospora sp. CPCC 206060]|uniref:hypothetical protein n=1 Tax=Micromonospora sp. CPCC 206060 TaxID=3122406 RepID=UPI003FA59840